MSAKVDVYMPMFVGDWLKDTADLSMEEAGTYDHLIKHMWNQGGFLRFNHDRLARLCRFSRAQWDAVWSEIERFFIIDEEAGTISQKRVLVELQVAREKQIAASENGKRGADARWGGHSHPIRGANAVAIAGAIGDAIDLPMANTMAKNSSSPSGSSPSGSYLPLSASDAGARSNDGAKNWWGTADWYRAFSAAWCVKYQRLAYGIGSAADGKATGDLDELLASLPPADRIAAKARANVMIREFLDDADPKVAKARHPWSWFVARFNTARVPQQAPPQKRDVGAEQIARTEEYLKRQGSHPREPWPSEPQSVGELLVAKGMP